MRSPLVGLACILAAGAPRPALAQGASYMGPSFLIARYASRSAMGMYAGYAAHSAMFVVGLLHNPRTSYREIMAGVGMPLRFSADATVTVASAMASTDTGWYTEFYVIPSLHRGPVRFDATVEAEQPWNARGSRAVYVSPANFLVDVHRGVAVGLGYYGSSEAGSGASHALGPALQLAVPRGSVTLELIKGVLAAEDEARVTFRSSLAQ